MREARDSAAKGWHEPSGICTFQSGEGWWPAGKGTL